MATAERILYLDASALVKLVVAERESRALAAAVTASRLVSSELALTEVPRAVRRASGARSPGSVERLLRALSFIPVSRRVLARAGALEEPFLRTLDAIHVASALEVADELDVFVTYDASQARAARLAGFAVSAPA